MPEILLAAQVPDLQANVLVSDLLDVGPDGRLGDDDLIERELVEDGCFAGVVEPDY